MPRVIRQTSIQAYKELVERGALSKKRAEVYQVLYQYGPMTATECFEHLKRQGRSVNFNTRTRFGELRDLGVVCEAGTTKCSVTGRTVILWDVTSRVTPLARPQRDKRLTADEWTRRFRSQLCHTMGVRRLPATVPKTALIKALDATKGT